MKKIKVGINGFGRIGKILLRIISKRQDMEVVAINNPRLEINYAQYLFNYDSIHGKFDGKCEVKDGKLFVNGKKIEIFNFDQPKDIPWGKVGVDVVCDATGVFKSKKELSGHLKGGAKKVIITAPAEADVPTIVFGVNNQVYNNSINVISASSCTTNCLSPLVKVIDDNFGIEEGLMTTIHSSTATQKVVDGSSKKDFRGGRAASNNIIPSSTGAAKAAGIVLPHLKGKITGMSFRVPTLNVSVVDFTCNLKKQTTYENIIKVIQKAERNAFKGIIKTTSDPVVSSDFISDPNTCIVDTTAGIMLSPTFVKLVAWYDNEYGYSTQVVNLIAFIMNYKEPVSKTSKKK